MRGLLHGLERGAADWRTPCEHPEGAASPVVGARRVASGMRVVKHVVGSADRAVSISGRTHVPSNGLAIENRLPKFHKSQLFRLLSNKS